jgi:hypothetical protein
MMVAILVIGYVLFLRYLDKKNREKDRQKLGGVGGLADYASLKKDLASLSERLAAIENTYRELDQRLGGLS